MEQLRDGIGTNGYPNPYSGLAGCFIHIDPSTLVNQRRRLWQLWLAFYLVWTGGAALLVYDEAKEAAQTFSKSRAIKAGQPIEACELMSEMAAADKYDRKLMELYYTVYEQRFLKDLQAELKALNVLEIYFHSATESTGRRPHLDNEVHAVLRACAKARVRVDEAVRSQRIALGNLAFYAGVVLLPPLIALLGSAMLLWLISRLRQGSKHGI